MLKFLLVVAVFAALVYALMWTLEQRRARGSEGGSGGGGGLGRRPRKPGPPPRQVAPDDDEDFLRWLERKRRKEGPSQ